MSSIKELDYIKEMMKRELEEEYKRGYKDGVEHGVVWHTENPKRDILNEVAVHIVEYGDYEYATEYDTVGYYYKGEWFINGKPNMSEVEAWAEIPKYEVKTIKEE